MKLSEFKKHLIDVKQFKFVTEDGKEVPAHFHVTEVGKVHRHFIDCGGKEREEVVVNLQLWNAGDYNHRLHPEKLIQIIDLSISQLQLPDVDVEVEYQTATIGKYGLEFKDGNFILTHKKTACLAQDACGIPDVKPRIIISDLNTTCAPGSGCC